MRRFAPQIFTVAFVAVICGGYIFLPRSRVVPSLWIVGGLYAVAVGYFAVQAMLISWRHRHLAQLAAATATQCPSCGYAEHDYRSGGLWDGVPDPITGHQPGGSFGYGVCKRCGSRWGQWDGAPPYVPSDEEWERAERLL